MPYHRGMQHYLTGLGDVLKLRVAASSNRGINKLMGMLLILSF
jgi:hypothetical protein